jgi:hypothetical protein
VTYEVPQRTASQAKPIRAARSLESMVVVRENLVS